ncbi:MAG: FtsW/RodA/SpoVE family cell cycle protein [Clostridia bacterium]|nr:FtsW/RodA/SpoVE family cell cycle protein [Clostridia bacterium]MBQ4605049.1 FtsW/RodA/SpoVE family cell cycle protein [Clostridia bacterium]
MSNKSSIKYALKETDFILFLLCLFTTAFGVLMVHSATRNDAIADGTLIGRDCLVMIAAASVGIIACVIISFLDYDAIVRLWPLAGGVCLLLLLILFPLGEGAPGREDAKCWLRVINFGGVVVRFQPSELAKIGFLITFTAHIEAVKDSINSLKNVLLLLVHAIVPIGIIILTDDLGSAMVFAFIFVGMMFVSGVQLRYFAVAIGGAVAFVPLIWTKFLASFHKYRILAIYYPSSLSEDVYEKYIYQQQRGLNAIGSGQFWGDGLFKGTYTQSATGVPVNESDMVFTVVGEELGFIGAAGFLAVMVLIIVRIISVGKKSRNLSGSLLCFGTAFMIGSQTIINIGMCLKLFPCIGITLPFLSAGGSSNLCIYFAIGIVMSVYRFNCNRDPINFRLTHLSTPFSEA